jgi:hypothetical protein
MTALTLSPLVRSTPLGIGLIAGPLILLVLVQADSLLAERRGRPRTRRIAGLAILSSGLLIALVIARFAVIA